MEAKRRGEDPFEGTQAVRGALTSHFCEPVVLSLQEDVNLKGLKLFVLPCGIVGTIESAINTVELFVGEYLVDVNVRWGAAPPLNPLHFQRLGFTGTHVKRDACSSHPGFFKSAMCTRTPWYPLAS